MSRLKQYAHSLASGYVLMGANILFTLASVPLALRYLSKAEFGLWALTSQLAGYIALIDLGMAGVSRILIDYKDQKAGGNYGSVIQTLLWVSLVQGALMVACGTAIALGLSSALGVPDTLAREFGGLIVGQSGLLAGQFLTRLFLYLLGAHQRYDLTNYAQVVSFGCNFAVLWWGFHQRQGVYSMLWGQMAGWFISAAVCFLGCVRLGLFPPAGCWGRTSMQKFWELFAYGRDIFLFFLGSQLVNASQTILITRTLGLDAAAVWSVCTRTYLLLTQAVNRIFDYSCAVLAEMIVRQEKERLFRRFRSIVVLSSSLSVWAAVTFSVCNAPFVRLWSGGTITWTVANDVLLGCWLVICVPAYCHLGLVGQRKEFRFARYVYFLEGALFVAASLICLRWGGVTMMLVASIVGGLLFRLPYAQWRTAEFFGLPLKAVAWDWSRPSVQLAVLMAPLGAGAWWLTRWWPDAVRFPVCGLVVGGGGLVLVWKFGLEATLRAELWERCPPKLQAMIRTLGGG